MGWRNAGPQGRVRPKPSILSSIPGAPVFRLQDSVRSFFFIEIRSRQARQRIISQVTICLQAFVVVASVLFPVSRNAVLWMTNYVYLFSCCVSVATRRCVPVHMLTHTARRHTCFIRLASDGLGGRLDGGDTDSKYLPAGICSTRCHGRQACLAHSIESKLLRTEPFSPSALAS